MQSWTGLDAEYRPQAQSSQDRVATLQIATPDKVFIIDVVTLTDALPESAWERLVRDYFANKSVGILGFGLRGDFQVMAKSMPAVFGELEARSESVLDVEMLEKRLTGVSAGGLVDRPFATDRGGLAGLVEAVLGRPLDKRDQMSDWDKRPLSANQLVYAALDAHVLVELFRALEMLAAEAQGKESAVFNAIVAEQIKWRNKLPPSQGRGRGRGGPRMTSEEKAKERRAALDELRKIQRPETFKPLFEEPIAPSDLKVRRELVNLRTFLHVLLSVDLRQHAARADEEAARARRRRGLHRAVRDAGPVGRGGAQAAPVRRHARRRPLHPAAADAAQGLLPLPRQRQAGRPGTYIA